MNSVLVLVLLTICVTVSVAQISPYPEVTIEQGILRGNYETSANGRKFAAFLGIPYAQPPVGKLRFKEPKSPKPWVGVYYGEEKRPECLQYSHLSYTIVGDEDCLYLNVFTPAVSVNSKSSQLLDVIVYIHGGAFMFLNGSAYGPRYLMDRDVVYVNFNYRLGPLGFLSTKDAIIPGNNGLKDQSAALRWVQKNIAAFGGNPASVTLIGLSAGGTSTHYHYLSPLSQGLFTRGISFSGNVLNPWSLTENVREKAFQLGSNLGCNTQDSTILLECLRNRPANQIQNQCKKFMAWYYNPYSPFGPTVEVEGTTPFLTEEPYQLLKSGKFQHLPWITALTSEEGLYPAADFISPPQLKELESRWIEIFPHILDFNFTVEPELKQDVCNAIKRYYLQDKSLSQNTAQLIQMLGDRLFVVGAEEAAKIQAEMSSAPVYFYYISYRGLQSLSNAFTHNDDNHGVSHGDDIAYFLHCFHLNPEITPSDREMTQRFLDFMTSYARDGIPRFMPNFVFPTVKEGLPNLKYIHIKSPKDFVQEQATHIGHSEFWFNLPLQEAINIAKQEAAAGIEYTRNEL